MVHTYLLKYIFEFYVFSMKNQNYPSEYNASSIKLIFVILSSSQIFSAPDEKRLERTYRSCSGPCWLRRRPAIPQKAGQSPKKVVQGRAHQRKECGVPWLALALYPQGKKTHTHSQGQFQLQSAPDFHQSWLPLNPPV